MDLVEIRDLDGPNLFALVPAIKLEVRIDPDELLDADRCNEIAGALGSTVTQDPVEALRSVITSLHERSSLTPQGTTVHELDLSNHLAVCFPWGQRAISMAIARLAFELTAGEVPEELDARLEEYRNEYANGDDHPTWIRDDDRRVPIAAITGTNGKTTTTRLLTHILRTAGYRVGWSSSTGVYIEGKQVLDGDYTGHGGARRVLNDPEIDYGVLETARGGILLRGLGFESNDVGVLLNVSTDHLYLHGVTRLETLARVKATVARVTRRDGVAVLNADDPLILAQREQVAAELMLISRMPSNPEVDEHLQNGGRAVIVEDGDISLAQGPQRTSIVSLSSVPLTYQGAAAHMVENSLAAVAAAIGLGIDHSHIRQGLQSFRPDAEHNAGRLNVFDVDGRTVVVDYAHNESGLTHLIDFADALFPDDARRTAIIGAAGDRGDTVLVRLGVIAGQRVDRVILKETPHYLRGRSGGEVTTLLRQGVHESGHPERLFAACDREYDAVLTALDDSQPGDVILVMCTEDYTEIVGELERRGGHVRESL